MMLPVVHRRQFLKLASVAAVGVAFSERKLFAANASGLVPLLSVGYAASLPESGSTIAMTDAADILSPDPVFISRAARVRVVGGSRTKQNMDGGIGVDAYFPITGREAAAYPRFSFWSASGDTQTGPLSFRMPVLATTGLSFVVRRLRPTVGNGELNTVPALEAETSPLTLSLGKVPGPKLARGVYALVFREENSDSAPNWGRNLLINQNGKYSVTVAGPTYLLIDVDYDNDPAPNRLPTPPRNRSARH